MSNLNLIGVAVGSQSLVIVSKNELSPEVLSYAMAPAVKKPDLLDSDPDLEDDINEAEDDSDKKPDLAMAKVPYDQIGLKAIKLAIDESGDSQKRVVLTGNRRWALPLAYALGRFGYLVLYLGASSNGGKTSGAPSSDSKIAKFLKSALSAGHFGRRFFPSGQTGITPASAETDHPWVSMVLQYKTINGDIRRAKHRVLGQLLLLFPELRQLGLSIWEPKYRPLLMACDWAGFAKFGYNVNDSLGQFVPISEKEPATSKLRQELFNLKEAEAAKDELIAKINGIEAINEHPFVIAYNGSFSAKLVALQLAWRDWGATLRVRGDFGPCWRQLRAYSGLAVSSVKAKAGKIVPCTHRVRRTIAGAAFFLLRSTRGKAVIAATKKRKDKKKMKRLEMISLIIKDFWLLSGRGVDQLELADQAAVSDSETGAGVVSGANVLNKEFVAC